MYKVKIINTEYTSRNVKRFVLEKPKDLIYRPGQSAHISIDKEGWRNRVKPFTFTSLNAWPFLELYVKIYDDRKGMTHELGKLKPGDELLIHDIFGTIEFKGPGIFLAGGTGITPFMAIFRALHLTGNMRGIGLMYSNRTQEDVMFGAELFAMLGNAYLNVFTRQGVIGFKERHIDRNFLMETLHNFNGRFYVCGPKGFVEDITAHLVSLGANPQAVIV